MEMKPDITIDFSQVGKELHRLMTRLFPICRSLTGPGVRETLSELSRYLPLQVHEVPSGTEVFDWTVPREWSVRDAYVLDPEGRRIIDFQENNLHLVGYSTPVDQELSLEELQNHLYSLPEQPDAIPYITSYYRERWGFCLSHRQRESLPEGNYRVVVDSTLADGVLNYGEVLIPGESDEEVFLSTYICHPSMANNELSGPMVATGLGQWLASRPRRFSYRIIFIPETIGALTYLSRNLEHLRKKVVAGFNLTCLGDDRTFSYVPSRAGDTLADRAALCVLKNHYPEFKNYSFLDRGSDERQYCAPGVDLPIASVMRSKYREYPEYHTSLDNLELVTPTGLAGGFEVLKQCIELIEANRSFRTTCLGEPQLGKYGLYPDVGTRDSHKRVIDMLNLLAYADGAKDSIALSTLLDIPPARLLPMLGQLFEAGLIEAVPEGNLP